MSGKNTLYKLKELEVRLYELETISHLAIGTGEVSAEFSPVEKPIIRAMIYDEKNNDIKRIPYIPASSIHGVLRTWAEKYIRSSETKVNTRNKLNSINNDSIRNEIKKQAKEEKAIDNDSSTDDILFKNWEVYSSVCDIFSELDKCEVILEKDKEKMNYKLEWLKEIGRSIPCKVCKIFGYMGERGKIRLTNAYPSKEEVPLDIITRVAINRYTGASDPGKLFDLEAIPPGIKFYFFVIMENLHEDQKKLFDYAVRAVNLQLATLGAYSTVGFGMVELKEIYSLTLNPKIFNLPIEDLKFEDFFNKNFKLVANIDIGKYPKFLNLLSLRKENKLPEQIAQIEENGIKTPVIEILRPKHKS
ncbi:MAG: RAMP superfamily CRISPR-associated protein [Promethearchaeota archaeon]